MPLTLPCPSGPTPLGRAYGKWKHFLRGPAPNFMAIIQAVFYDEYGRKVGASVESDDDLLAAARERRVTTHQVTVGDVHRQDKGKQRRPARHDVRFNEGK